MIEVGFTPRHFLLLAGYRLTSGRACLWFHENVRWFYAHPTKWLLRRALIAAGGRRLNLEVRNSVSHGPFNAFMSDLDLAVVVTDSVDIERAVKAVTRVRSIRRLLPFVGEFEIYTLAEWRVRLELEAAEPLALGLVSGLRRLNWQRRLNASASSSYQRSKNQRATENRLSALLGEEQDLSAGVGAKLECLAIEKRVHFSAQELPVKGSGHSGFLGSRIRWDTEREDESEDLFLRPDHAAILAAILPDGDDFEAFRSEPLHQLRSGSLTAPFAAVVAMELMLVRSTARLCEMREDGETWMAYLRALLLKYSPETLANIGVH
jgi:hypothetical protein